MIVKWLLGFDRLMSVLDRIRAEFEASPIQASAAAVALALGPLTILLNYLIGSGDIGTLGGAPSVAAADAPFRLFLLALFALLVSFGLANVLRLAKNIASGLLLAAILMFMAQIATATFARQVLIDQFQFATASTGTDTPTSSELLVAGINVDSFVFGSCIAIGLVFMAVVMGFLGDSPSSQGSKSEDSSEEPSSSQLDAFLMMIPVSFVAIVLPVSIIGGFVFEAFLRAGLISVTG